MHSATMQRGDEHAKGDDALNCLVNTDPVKKWSLTWHMKETGWNPNSPPRSRKYTSLVIGNAMKPLSEVLLRFSMSSYSDKY